MATPTPHPMDTSFEQTGANRYIALRKLGASLGTTSLGPMVMATTGEWLRAKGHYRPHMYFDHPAVDDKQSYLNSIAAEVATGMGTEIPPRMLKTVTLTFGSGDDVLRVLVGSVGRRIDTAVKKTILTDWVMPGIEVTSKQAKSGVINPQDGWDPGAKLGLEPGVVGPLLGEVSHDVLAYYFLAEDFDPAGPVIPVELAISPEASLVMGYHDLLDMLPIEQAAFLNRHNFFRVIPPTDTISRVVG